MSLRIFAGSNLSDEAVRQSGNDSQPEHGSPGNESTMTSAIATLPNCCCPAIRSDAVRVSVLRPSFRRQGCSGAASGGVLRTARFPNAFRRIAAKGTPIVNGIRLAERRHQSAERSLM